MIQAGNPDVAAALLHELEEFPLTPVLGEAASTARELVGVQGFEAPLWRAQAAGERRPDREPGEGGNMRRRQEWNADTGMKNCSL